MKPCLVAFLISWMGLTSVAQASVDGDLHHFFDRLGYQSNVTQPRAYQDQAAGYYSGGSLYLRNQVKNFQISSVELPSVSGGCAGIDLFLGSFSVISAKNLTRMVKNILSSAGSYAFDLALTTTMPQVKSVKDYIQKYINDINNTNADTCAVSESLVGGLWPKTAASQQQICRDLSAHSGSLNDWASARQGCGSQGNFSEQIGDGGSHKKEVIINKNLVWAALNDNGLTASDHQLAEFLMSLSGSIIITQVGDHSKRFTLVSLAKGKAMVNALLKGGDATIYHCDDYDKCLHPTTTQIKVTPENSLVAQVTGFIEQLNNAVLSDSGELPGSLRGFLEKTPLPVLKYITNSLSLGKSVNPTQFSELIAVSLLNQYVSENITLVQQAMSEEDTQLSSLMLRRIRQAQAAIAQELNGSYRTLSNIDVLKNSLRQDEQQLTGRLLNQANAGNGIN